MKPLPLFGAIPPGLAARVAVSMKQPHQLAMCRDEARHVGEIVAMVLAGSRALAEDGCELVEVDYEPLPALADVEAAARPDAPVLYPAWGDNIALSFKTGFGDVEAAFREADARVRERFVIPRYVGMPIETRGVVAQWDRARRRAHHVERHPGRPLRPAGAGGRARAAAAQDPRHRPRRGRRLRHQGQRLRGGPADPRRGHRWRAGR